MSVHEPFPLLQTAIAIFSGGIVAPSDQLRDHSGVQVMNKDLLLKTISMNGFLLKPDFPAVVTDFEIAGSSNGWPGKQDGLFYRTFSKHHISYPKGSSWHITGDEMTWGYALTLNQTSDFEISKNRLS